MSSLDQGMRNDAESDKSCQLFIKRSRVSVTQTLCMFAWVV